jgi:uncharacterized repeat protein (TIGR01451 family)
MIKQKQRCKFILSIFSQLVSIFVIVFSIFSSGNFFDSVKVKASSGNTTPTFECPGNSSYENYADTPTAPNVYILNTAINSPLNFTKSLFLPGLTPAPLNSIDKLCVQPQTSTRTLFSGTGSTINIKSQTNSGYTYNPVPGYIGTICFDAYLKAENTDNLPGIYNFNNTHTTNEGSNIFTVKIQVGGWTGDCATTPQITNTATVSANEIDPNTSNNSASATDTICELTELQVNSFTDGLGFIGAQQNGTYTAEIINNGLSNITEYKASFSYDKKYLTFQSFTPSLGTASGITTSILGDLETQNINISNLLLMPGQKTKVLINYTVKNGLLDQTAINSEFNITPIKQGLETCTVVENITNNNKGVDLTTYQALVDLNITKVSSGGGSSITGNIGTVQAGSNLSYTISVVNNGPDTGTGIKVVDTVPPLVTPILQNGTNYTNSSGWSCSLTIPTITCTNSNPFISGSSSNIILVGKVASASI